MPAAAARPPARPDPARGALPGEGQGAEGQGALREAARLGGLWVRAEPWTAGLLVAAALLLTLGQIALGWGLAVWNRDAFDALGARNGAAFAGQLGVFAALTAAGMAVAVARLWARQAIAFRWRRWLVLGLQRAMLEGGRHYRLAVSGAAVDNPDQRIGENTRWATIMAVDLALGLLHAAAMFLAFAGMLWGLSDGLLLPGTGAAVPGGLLWAAMLFAGLCGWVTWRVGRAMPGIHMDRNQAEADHRFALLRVQEHAEAIALVRGEADEIRGLGAAYARVEAAMLRLLRSERQLMWLGSSYLAVAGVLPLVLLAPGYFAGALTLGILMQAAHAFVEVTRALCWFVDAWPRLADWRCHVARVVELERSCAAPEPRGAILRREAAAGAPAWMPPGALELRGLDLGTACGRALVAGAELRVAPGERVLITGESGSGKSTLFRAIAGLWPWGEGDIRLPGREGTMFLPQRPYLPLGSLGDALCYPAPPGSFGREAMAAALLRCRLPLLAARLEEVARWDRVLSLGEQQRVAFARVLLHRPGFVFMDEATSALDEASQDLVFALLAVELPSASLLSIGHRPGLEAFHDRVLRMQPGPGGARLVAAGSPRPARGAAVAGPERSGLTRALVRPSVG